MTALASLNQKKHRLTNQLTSHIPAGVAGISKRVLDLAITLPLIIFLAPLLITIALIIGGIDGNPVLYRHIRHGRGGSVFTLYKFRTMVPASDELLADLLAKDPTAKADWVRFRKLRHDPRVTRLGAFLRKSSLDELPQLFNVLRGEMSLVGPRPVVTEELAQFGTAASYYQAAKPGITGLWQISGRNDADFTTRIELDTAYVCSWSLSGDIAILAKTVPIVLMAKGAY
ncbi:MAG: sugar transferase [Pseudomonadota bacterium]